MTGLAKSNNKRHDVNKSSSPPPARHWLEAWHVDPSANRNFDFIDGLRGVAILMVVVCHYLYFRDSGTVANRFLHNFLGNFGRGVDLFFTLSGFLISWPFWKRKVSRAEQIVPPGYGWRRFWKIYPPLALSILVLTPCSILWLGQAPQFIRTALQWLTGLAFLMPVSDRLNPVMWSLVVEIHFYLVLPLLFLLTKPLTARTCLWVISLFLFAVPVLIQSLTGLGPTFSPEINDPFFTGLSCFCLGVGLAGCDNLKFWHQRWGRLGDVGWYLMLGGLAGLAWVSLNPEAHGVRLPQVFHLTFFLGTGCLLCYATDPQNPRARWLCAPWLRWCGIISYEWYLFHQPMIAWSRELAGPAGGGILKYLFIIGVPLVVGVTFSALVYRKFSLPILKYGRARNRRPA